MKTRLLFYSAFLFSGISFSQITDPTPYCMAEYSDDIFEVPHSITKVELNTLDNDSGMDAFAAPHYVYYNGIPATDLNRGDTYDLVITHDDGVTIHGIAAWIDFNANDVFEDAEKVGETLWPSGTNPLTYSVTIPATAAVGITRMRVRVYEDDDYTFSGIDLPVLPCQYDIGMGDTDYDWGETEDYDVNIIDDDPDPVALMALFTPEDETICVDDVLTFTDASISEDGVTDWSWTFDGGTPAAATTVGPHDITYSTAGVYNATLEVTDATGTHDTTFVITVEDCTTPLTALFTPENETVCVDDVITFTDASISEDGVTDWNWTFDGGTPAAATTVGPHDITYSTAGVYNATLEVTDATGTHDTTFVITVLADCDDIVASFNPTDIDICEGECLLFEDASTGVGIVGYSWTFSDPDLGGPILGPETGTICFENPGEQEVTLTITNGVVFDDTTIVITVHENPVITIDAFPAIEVCVGEEVTLNGEGGVAYVWSGGVVDGVAFTPIETTDYVVIGEDEFGCLGEAEITITVVVCEEMEVDFDLPENICLGDCIRLEDATIGGAVSWNWDFGGGGTPETSTEENPLVCFETPGIFDVQLTVENAAGDIATLTKTIEVSEAVTVNAAIDTIIDLGGTAQLIANGSDINGDYLWSPSINLECENCPFATANPFEDQTYYVTHFSVNGCSAIDSVVVRVNFVEGVGVASAFSPNGDGTNDILFVQGYGIEQLHFEVYNRYGERVFETSDQKIGWDGTFHGVEENPGVFYWVLFYELVDGKSGQQKGNTTLVK